MNIFQTVLVVINFSTCDAFHSLNDLENFYKTAPVFDPFGATGELKSWILGRPILRLARDPPSLVLGSLHIFG